MSASRSMLCCALLVALAAAPLSAQGIYFNSYGWDKVYRLPAGGGPMQRIDPVAIGATRFFSSSDFDDLGRLWGIQSNQLHFITFGGLADWHQGAALAEAGSYLCTAPGGEFYVTSGSTLRRIDASGATIPGTGLVLTLNGSAFTPRGIDRAPGGALYATASDGIYLVNLANGSVSLAHARPNLNGGIFTDLDYGDDGLIRVLGSFNYLYTYNPANGSGIWGGELLYQGNSFSPSSIASRAVPEPTTGLLAALAALLGVRRRRARR